MGKSMNVNFKTYGTKTFAWGLLTWILLFVPARGVSQTLDLQPPPEEMARVDSIHIGPHPDFTRIYINLSRRVDYRVNADFYQKKVSLVMNAAELSPRVRSRIFKDVNLEKYEVVQIGNLVEIAIFLKNPNSRFIHFIQDKPTRIVLDIKGTQKPFITTRVAGKGEADSSVRREVPVREAVQAETAAVSIPGMSPKKLREILQKDAEDKATSGRDDYDKALKAFQKKEDSKAIQLFQKFLKNFPDSALAGNAAYLKAETEFQLGFTQINPVYEAALSAYQFALRRYPDSRFQDHALLKVAFIFQELGYGLEARALYEDGLRRNPKSPYSEARNLGLAQLRLKEKGYDDAYNAFKKILKTSPENIDAQKGIFEVAQSLYEEKHFGRALEVFEEGVERWPSQLNVDPRIHFQMAEIYFRKKLHKQARFHYFAHVNLNPESEEGHRALNRIGDSYFLEENYENSLAIFDDSSKLNPGSRESQYGLIRLADIGVRDPALPLKNIVFDLSAYYHPFDTYNQIEKTPVDQDILAEVTLSRGVALLKEHRFLEAVKYFKRLLPLGPNSHFYQEAKNNIRQALIFLVDRYSEQEGYLPILYSYADYQNLRLEPIDNLKTLVQIGEAYQAISMYQEAVQFYQKVKKLDVRRLYSDRVFLNLGRLHLEQKNYADAEIVARTFLANFTRSSRMSEAVELLAASYEGRGNYQSAIDSYLTLVDAEVNPSKAFFMIGENFNRLGDLNQATHYYQEAIDAYDHGAGAVPKHIPPTYHKLGFALFKNGELVRGKEILKAAKELFPEHWLKDWNSLQLAEAYQQNQETENAGKELDQLAQSATADDILKRAAKTELDMLQWEKQFKDLL